MIRLIQFLFLLTITFALTDCTETSDSKAKTAPDTLLKGVTPDQTGWDLEVFFVDSSFTKAILHAKRGRVYQNRMETKLDGGMRVDFFSQTSKGRVSYLTADSAVIDDKTKNMIARGHVFVYADSSKATLNTSVLQWNNTTQKIFSTEYVVFNRPGETITGWGFESDQNLNNYKIYKVSGVEK